MADNCIFCKIVKGQIPSTKLVETDHTYAFLDINPLSEGHLLVISKEHGERLHDLSEDNAADVGRVLNRLAKAYKALGIENYNILQNNGEIAHQVVKHVHFHLIPKPNQDEGLGIEWPATKPDFEKLKAFATRVQGKL